MGQYQAEEGWLDIKSVGWTIHCPNAGVFEYSRQDLRYKERENDRIANLSYTPSFDIAALNEEEEPLRKQVYWSFAIVLPYSVGMAFVLLSLHPILILVIGLIQFAMLYQFTGLLLSYWRVGREIVRYKRSKPTSLPSMATEPIPISWWELVKSGLSPTTTRNYIAEEQKLFGRPWRLLIDRDNRQCIPVLQQNGAIEENPVDTETGKYILALCANLIESNEGSLINWGVIVERKSKKGIAIPMTSSLKQYALRASFEVAQRIRDATESPKLRAAPLGACINCPLSRPRLEGRYLTEISVGELQPNFYRLADVIAFRSRMEALRSEELGLISVSLATGENTPTEIDEIESNSGKTELKRKPSSGKKRARFYHSACGDLFRWAPDNQFWERRS